MKNKLRSYLPTAVGMVFGAAGGFLYWNYVGCDGGACAITSDPWLSTLFGAILGSSLAGILEDLYRKFRQPIQHS